MSPIKFTKAGWLYIILTILMGFSAINTNNNLVFITVSLMLAVMGISGFFGKSNIENLSFEFSFEEEIYASRKTKIKVNVINNKSAIFSALLNINILDDEEKVIFLKPKQSASLYFIKTFTERGFVKIDKVIVTSIYPFNFFIRAKVYAVNEELVIFPRLIDNSFIPNSAEDGDIVNDFSVLPVIKSQEELSNIRSYNNDPMSKIFWKHYAKNENLYTKEFTSEKMSYLYVIFEDLINAYGLEKGISIATTIIYEASIKKQPLLFQVGNKEFNIGNVYEKREVLKRLAIYGKS
ncbi:DUF58 domain-containing protein [Deferribacteraceae bacterium V6Fe1]|nr:DUF58 domain-containing protein [Deferribacteraceae bacterium V6Fe1]